MVTEEEEEEWLLQSLHLYEALHAFELQAPTRVIEWALGKRVCVAGYGCAGRNEILQLLPPPALQAKESWVGAAAAPTQRGLSEMAELRSRSAVRCAWSG